MVITYSVILIGLLFLIRPLQKNSFYILHAALVILAAYYIETHYFRASVLRQDAAAVCGVPVRVDKRRYRSGLLG